jgi:hypothetical protein
VPDFCARLREQHGFKVGHAEAHESLRALEALGVEDEARVRTALRCICCGSPEDIAVFEAAFDAFFRPADAGVAQSQYDPRHTRPGNEPVPAAKSAKRRRPSDEQDELADGPGLRAEREAIDEMPGEAAAWQMMRARYSPAAGAGDPPQIPAEDFEAMLTAARRLVDNLRLGRSRRWRPQLHGRRFDTRRTLRASLQTGGDPAVLRRLGHPHRNPRFAVLVDCSRSMSEYAGPMLQFAYALVRRTRRARAFLFSTELQDVTRRLASAQTGDRLEGLGAAWGGGTRIGASLATFVKVHGGRVLSDDTVVIVASDGLDVGDPKKLERAMHELARRSAGVLWLNPHAHSPGFAPTAGGMRTALPYVAVLDSATDARGFERVARRLVRSVAAGAGAGHG